MSSRNLYTVFTTVMTVVIVVFFCLLFINPTGTQLNVFFLKTNDFFADFFNPMIYVADNDVYHNTLNGLHHKIYFPLTYMMFSLFSGFMDYSGLTLQDTYSSHPAMVSCLLFTVFSVFLFIHSLGRLVRLDAKLIAIILCSSVFLFTVERGNPIIIAAALAVYFLAYKDSESRRTRILALTALCVAVVLKGYPVVLGLYLLRDRQFKAIGYCIVVTLLLAFLPFLYFKGGFDNIPQFISNVQEHNRLFDNAIYPRFGLTVFNSCLIDVLHAYGEEYRSLGFTLTRGIVVLMALASMVLFFFQRTPWKRIMLLMAIVAYVPSDNGFYCGIYFLPALLLFLHHEVPSKRNYVYLALFILLLNPIQVTSGGHALTWLISNAAIFVMWAMLISETLSTARLSKANITTK